VSESLNRLVGRTVLPETNGIVGGNPDDLVASKSGETDGTGSVGDEVLSQMIRDPHNQSPT